MIKCPLVQVSAFVFHPQESGGSLSSGSIGEVFSDSPHRILAVPEITPPRGNITLARGSQPVVLGPTMLPKQRLVRRIWKLMFVWFSFFSYVSLWLSSLLFFFLSPSLSVSHSISFWCSLSHSLFLIFFCFCLTLASHFPCLSLPFSYSFSFSLPSPSLSHSFFHFLSHWICCWRMECFICFGWYLQIF